MKIVVLYRPNSEHERKALDFAHEFQKRYHSHSAHLEMLNIDTRDGSSTATLYDVMAYPAILVLRNDGYLQQSWQGDELPLMDEIFAYANV